MPIWNTMPNKTLEKQLAARIHGLYLNLNFKYKIKHNTIRNAISTKCPHSGFSCFFLHDSPTPLLSKHNSFKGTLQII